LIWINGLWPIRPNQPTWPGWTRPARVWVGQLTQPSPLTLSPLSSSCSLANPKSPPPSPDHSNHHRWPPPPTLGQNCRPNSLYHLLQLELMGASSPGRSWVGFPSVSTLTGRLRLDASPSPLLVLAVRPVALVMHACTPMEALWCGAPGVCSVKSSLGSLWPAAQALPCHVV
jgi:hypothetical protein